MLWKISRSFIITGYVIIPFYIKWFIENKTDVILDEFVI